jgi:hypothetical protein
MSVVSSASGCRIDCDECGHHASASALSPQALRSTTGYVSHDDRDYCPSCWYRHTASRFRTSSSKPANGGPEAA